MLKCFFNSIFKQKSVKKGQIYENIFYQRNKGNPFDDTEPITVEVKDVKNGWVNYKWIDCLLWQNVSMKMSRFLMIYRLIKDVEENK